MADPTVRVNKYVYLAAVADAIDWQESILDSHNPDGPGLPSCCTPGSRCIGYRFSMMRLRSYRAQRAAVLRKKSHA